MDAFGIGTGSMPDNLPDKLLFRKIIDYEKIAILVKKFICQNVKIFLKSGGITDELCRRNPKIH